jgi:hypothetical protein
MADHLTQMGQVQALLASDPTNTELLQLQTDLAQLIAMTLGEAAVPPLIQAGSASATAEGSAVPEEAKPKWHVDDKCMALYEDGVHYLAKITNLSSGAADADTLVEVIYLEFGNTASVPVSSLKPFVPAPSHALVKGAPVRAPWPQDGLYYDAVVHAKLEGSDDLFNVRFTMKKKKDYPVAGSDLVLREVDEASKAAAGDAEVLVIPDHLKWDQADNDVLKAKKRRQIKALKLKHKKRKLEAERDTKQASWQSFQKKKRGKLKGMKQKKSIFASGTGAIGVGTLKGGFTTADKQDSRNQLTDNKQLKKHVFEYMGDGEVPKEL